MRTLQTADYAVIAVYLAVVFLFGVLWTRRASRSVDDFFVGGRGLPWWLVGVSMAATNFSIDTPVSITGFVAREGVAGIWFFWAGGISAILVTFLFARLWRRTEVLTDAEIIELRYGGRPAAALRLFKGIYFGVVFNAFIMGWVFLALAKVVGGVTDLDVDLVLFAATALVFVYTVASGFYGVVLTDFVQYFVAFAGSIVLAWYAVAEAGGLTTMLATLEELPAAPPGATDFLPRIGEAGAMPMTTLVAYLGVQWWAHKYADGGGKHIQRMLSAKDERHSAAAALFFALINYALQVWPWILTALASLVIFGGLPDPEAGYALTMAKVLPTGVLGLVVACLVGAFMSTIDTHLNLGASYVVNDLYRRFVRPDESDAHYVFVSRLTMAALLGLALLLSSQMQSVGGAWKFLLTFASGAGLPWIVRWFWWRVNAWSELSAMVASGVVATTLQVGWPELGYGDKLMVTVALSTAVWLAVTFATPAVAEERLVEFVRKVRPGSPGWDRICSRYDIEQQPYLKRALLLWGVGLVALFGLNFGVGAALLGRPALAVGLGVVGLAATGVAIRSIGPSPAQ